MTLIQYYHITLESWAAVFCLVASVVIYPTGVFEINPARSCIALLMTDFNLNVAEVLAWAFRGSDSPAAFTVLRIVYATVFICLYLLLICMAWHMASVIITWCRFWCRP